MLTNSRAINKVIEPMGSRQPRIPLPPLLPKGWTKTVIDFKDCFITISSQEQGREKFAFHTAYL